MSFNNTKVSGVRKNDKILVELEGNPTTGYTWASYALEGNAILQDGEPTYEKNAPHHGKGGLFTFYYRAFQDGHSLIRLVNARHWDDDSDQDSFMVTIQVGQGN